MKLRSSDPIYIQQFEAIDAENGIIKGVKVCSEGDAKGHGIYLNKKFINNVVRLGKEQTVGVKARFGHPNMCDTTLGTYIGRFKNFKTVGEQNEDFEELGKPRKSGNRLHAVANLHFDDTAENLPKLGNVKEYLTSLAESSPDMFGSSIVFHMGETEVLKWKDEDGNEFKRNDATIESLLATDLVDSPASTDGLFSEFSTDEMAIQVTMFLDQHPEVYELAVDNPEIVEMFMGKYADYKDKKEKSTKNHNTMSDEKKSLKEMLEGFKTGLLEEVKTLLHIGDDEAIPEEVTTLLEEKFKEYDARISEAEGSAADTGSAAQEQIDSLKADIETANTTIDTLKTDVVKAKAASTKAPGKQGLEDPDALPSKEEAELNTDLASLKRRFEGVEEA